MRCTGKTTLAKALAKKLNRPWEDMDEQIKKKAGKSVSEIVTNEGWGSFRKMEQEVAYELSKKDHLIVATGGGALMFFKNAENFKKSGKIILLTADIEQLYSRVLEGKDRPALTEEEGLEELKKIWEERKETYHKWADFVIDTSDWDEERILTQFTQFLEA